VALGTSAPYTDTCTVTYPAAGPHSVTATYSGDTSTTSSTSTAVPVTVTTSIAPLAVATTSVPGGTAGTAYPTTTLAATGGVTPETWSLTNGSLPPGVVLYATGGLAGTPTTAGTYDFTVGVTDSEATPVTATQALEIVVAPATTTTGIAASQASISTGQSEIYTATVTSPVPPTGTVDFTDGSTPITGCQNVALGTSAPYTDTCTVTYPAAGPHSVTATYSGDFSTITSTSKPVAVSVSSVATPGPIITSTSSVAGIVGQRLSFAITATGTPTPRIGILLAGRGDQRRSGLPPGVFFYPGPHGTARLLGTPSKGGTYQATITATSAQGSTSQVLTIIVGPAATRTSVSASPPSVIVGHPETVIATVFSPVYPFGTVNLSDNGVAMSACQDLRLSGWGRYSASCTVRYDTTGSHSIVATYGGDISTESSMSPAAEFTVRAIPASPPKFTSSASISVPQGHRLNFPVTVSGYPSPVLSESATPNPVGGSGYVPGLPPGLQFLPAGSGIASIYGYPTKVGSYRITIKATNSAGSASQVFTITVRR
jgi:hypothetical protein